MLKVLSTVVLRWTEAYASQKAEKIDAAWVRKLALNFERRISKNSELRAKFEDDPQK